MCAFKVCVHLIFVHILKCHLPLHFPCSPAEVGAEGNVKESR